MDPASEQMQLLVVRKLYAKAHQQLQEAGRGRLRLEERIKVLEDENAALRLKAREARDAG